MAKRVALVHTVPSLAVEFGELAAELMPDVETVDLIREDLLKRTVEAGKLDPSTTDELAKLVSGIEDVDAVLVTCSTLGPAVDAARSACRVPLLRVDEPMVREAVRLGARIGVLATLPTTLEPTVHLIERVADQESREVELVAYLCKGAFEAVRAGDGERHDRLVLDGLSYLSLQVDVVVLAQASMARAVETLAEPPPVPVLTSPRLAVEHAASLLSEAECPGPA